jgi:hypothetical protein
MKNLVYKILIVVSQTLAGCTQTDDITHFAGSDEQTVPIKISVDGLSLVKSSVPENFNDFNFYVFDSYGNLESSLFSSGQNPVTIYMKKGVKSIAAIINLGQGSLNGVTTLAGLRQVELDGITGTNGNMVFAGECVATVTGEPANITIPVQRVAAKFTFLFDKSQLDPATSIVVTGINIKNTPSSVSLFLPNQPMINGIDHSGTYLSGYPLEPSSHDAAIPVYVAENLQGTIGSNSDPRHKHPGTSENLCTYIEVTAQYNSPYKTGEVRFRSFPGLNNTNNYDIVRGRHYMETIIFKGSSIADITWRTDISGLNDVLYNITASASPQAGGYVTGAGQYGYGETPLLQAHANPQYEFAAWDKPLAPVSGSAHYNAIFNYVPIQEPDIKVTGITLTPANATLLKGETTQLTATLIPSGATNKNISWSSSNSYVASVSPATGIITAHAPGSAIITALTEDGSFSASATIRVYEQLNVTIDKHPVIYHNPGTGVVDNGIIVIFARLDIPRPSDMNIVNTIRPAVQVNVLYSYTLNGNSLSGSAQLYLDQMDNNDIPSYRTNGHIVVNIQGPVSEDYIYQILDSLSIEVIPGSIYINNWYISW